MTKQRGTWPGLARPALIVLSLVVAVALAACSGGSSGAPTTLSLSGDKIPVSQVTTPVSQLCAVARQSQTDPGGAAKVFAGGIQAGINVLASVLAKDHSSEAQSLLNALAKYERDIGATPPDPETATSVNNLLQTAQQGLKALKVPVPSC